MTSVNKYPREILGHEEPRQPTWVLRALWSSAPRCLDTQHNDESSVSSTLRKIMPCELKLCIPDTVIFEQGEPRKWVGCSSKGVVVRKSFLRRTSTDGVHESGAGTRISPWEIRRRPLAIDSARKLSSLTSASRTLDDFEVLERLELVRAAFLSFAASLTPTGPDAPVCVARYNDGSTELLSDSTLRELCTFYNWRVSVSYLQAYVRPSKMATGTYKRQLSCREQRHTTRREGPNQESQSQGASRDGTVMPKPKNHASVAMSNTYGATDNAGGGNTMSYSSSVTASSAESESPGSVPITPTQMSRAALDQATMGVAFVTDMSYAWSEPPSPRRILSDTRDTRVNVIRDGDGSSVSPMNIPMLVGEQTGCGHLPWPKSRIRVARLEVEFIIDQNGCAWFSSAARVLVQSVLKQPAKEEQRTCTQNKPTEETAKAASVAARELRSMIALSARRGLNADDVFQHFDVRGRGCIGTIELLQGMMNLGVTLSEEAATSLIEMIVAGGNIPYSTVPPARCLNIDHAQGIQEKEKNTVGSKPSKEKKKTLARKRVAEPKRLSTLRKNIDAKDLWNFAKNDECSTASMKTASRLANDSTKGEVYLPSKYNVRDLPTSSRSATPSGSRIKSFVSKRKWTNKGGTALTGGDGIFGEIGKGGGPVTSDYCLRKSRRQKYVSSTPSGRNCELYNLSKLKKRRCGNTSTPSTMIFPTGELDRRKPLQSCVQPAVKDTTSIKPKIFSENPELAYFPCDDPMAEAISRKDHVFHVDRGLVIAYRVLRQTPNSYHHPPSTMGASDDSGIPCAAGTEKETCDESSLGPSFFVMVPGLFQTLDTLESAILPLLEAHPKLMVLLVAPPGSPNTHWPVAATLDGKLTALCVSILLEHLLENDELVTSHLNSRKCDIPRQNHGHSSHPPSKKGKHVEAPTNIKSVSIKSEPSHNEAYTVPPFPTVASKNVENLSPLPPPVVFVGFGTGANALLHLTAGLLSHSGCDQSYDPSDNADMGRGKEVCGNAPPRHAYDRWEASGRLASLLRRKTLRIGGLVLANGFVSLNEESTQVIRTLRQAFCNQNNGHARAEAIASLLLSEHHLPTSTRTDISKPSNVTKTFLETRKSLHLDADAFATIGGPSSLTPGEPNRVNRLGASREFDKTVIMDTVIQKIDETKQNRLHRLLQRRQEKHGTGHHRQEMPWNFCVDDGEQQQNGNIENEGKNNKTSRLPKTREIDNISGLEGEWCSTVRLALNASVSRLDGLLGNAREVYSSPLGTVDPSGENDKSSSGRLCVNVSAVCEAARLLEIPLLMVQSTEDSLVGVPLPFFLQQELLPEEKIVTDEGSIVECLKPSSNSTASIEEKNDVRLSGVIDPGEDGTRKGGAEGDRRERGNSDEDRGHGKELLRAKICWVKAGHDVLHERGSFMLALLHKTLYACHGREPPPATLLFSSPRETNDGSAPKIRRTNGGDRKVQPSLSDGETFPDRSEEEYWPDDGSSPRSRRYRRNMDESQRGDTFQKAAPAKSKLSKSDNALFYSSSPPVIVGNGSEDGVLLLAERKDSGGAGGPETPSSTVTAETGTTTTTLSSATTVTAAGTVPKLLDFYNLADEDSNREFRAARECLEKFLGFDLDRAVLEGSLGFLKDRAVGLDVPTMAGYAFETMKECWRCKVLAVESTRLDIDMRKNQKCVREQLAFSVRAVNNLTRTLRKSGRGPSEEENIQNILLLEPLDQQALKAEIRAAKVKRAVHYDASRRLRRCGAVFRARRERLESTLRYLTQEQWVVVEVLERVMAQLRKQLALVSIQQKVFQQELDKVEQKGLRSRRRLAVVKEQLMMLEDHPHKWTDSDAWQPGYVQRTETTELVKLLVEERQQLQSAAEEACKQGTHTQELYLSVSNQEAQLAFTMEGVGAVAGLLKTTLENENFTQDLEAAAEEQISLESEITGFNGNNGDIGQPGTKFMSSTKRKRRGIPLQSVAAHVRITPHRTRTPDEKRWVALDAVLNPHLYHHVTLTEAEEMKWDTLYYTRLDREDILRIISLPPQIQLALPLLHTPDDVVAHELLRRFTLGISPDYFAKLDRNSQDICVAALAIGSTSQTESVGKKANTATIEEDGAVGASRRVLAYMRRGAEAQTKLSAERDEEEAVWVVLDQKLRPHFHRNEDQAAGERNEELHREADSREDDRNSWLKDDEETIVGASGSGGDVFNAVDRESNAHAGAEEYGVAGSKAWENHETLAAKVVEKFDIDRLKRLAAGQSLGKREFTGTTEGTQEVGVDAPAVDASIEEVFNNGEVSTMETAEVCVAPPRNTNDEKGSLGSINERRGGNGSGTCWQAFTNGDNPDAVEERNSQERLVHFVQQVFSRFFVREEETPVGRHMTQSLAILQEVALRLGRGQHNIFSGLNQQTAFAILFKYPQVPPSAEESNTSVVSEANTKTDTAAAEETARVEFFPGEEEPPTGAVTMAAPSRVEKQYISSMVTSTPSAHICEIDGGGGNGTSGERKDCHKMDMINGLELTRRGGFGPERLSHKNIISAASGAREKTGSGNDPEPKQKQKVFGSWEEIHPASLGIDSQVKDFCFTGKNEGAEEQVHPASFRSSVHKVNSSDDCSMPSIGNDFILTTADAPSHAHLYHDNTNNIGMDPLDLLTGGGHEVPGWLSCADNGGSSLVAPRMDAVGNLDPGEVRRRGLLVASRNRKCLLEVKTCELNAGQSKCYAFDIGPYRFNTKKASLEHQHEAESFEFAKVVIGMAVTVVYQGTFEKEGYRLGRLAAGLYRMPPLSPRDKEEGTIEAEDYDLPQSLNTPDTMGRIMIFHQPRVQPVREGRFQSTFLTFPKEYFQSLKLSGLTQLNLNVTQLVIGAASRVRYSVTVSALTAVEAHIVFEEEFEETKRLQERLPLVLADMEALKDISKLSRWKQRIVRELQEEAQEEAVRCDSEVNEVKREIQEDENDQQLDDDGRRALDAEASDLMAELRRWKMMFTSRSQEGKDVRAGLESIKAKTTALQNEADAMKKCLAQARKSLPAAMFVLQGSSEAVDIALKLNATVDPFSGATAKWAAVDLLKERGEETLTPAERVRRALKEDGWNSLSLDEQRFTMLDRVLWPEFYQWMKESRIDQDGNIAVSSGGPLLPKPRKDSLAELIGAGPLASMAIDGVGTIEEAMQAKTKQGWSKKAISVATLGVRRGNATSPGAGGVGGALGVPGSITARSETKGGGETTARSGIATARSGAATSHPTAAETWRLPDYSFTAMEVERVQNTPFQRLQREELRAHKLLARFNDKKKSEATEQAAAHTLAQEFETRCAAVRAKHAATRTPQEREWVKIDKVMFPDIWRVKRRQEERLKQFNMTLSTLPAPPTWLDDTVSDGYDNDEVEKNTPIGGGNGRSNDGGSSRRTLGGSTTEWQCPFDKEEIMQIWARCYTQKMLLLAVKNARSNPEMEQICEALHLACRPSRGAPVEKVRNTQEKRAKGVDLMTDRENDVERVRQLLQDFNGIFSVSSRNGRGGTNVKCLYPSPLTMSASKHIAVYTENKYRTDEKSAKENEDLINKVGGKRGPGLDANLIVLLREFIAAKTLRTKYMDTDAIHRVPQRFNTEYYAMELEREIASQLREQILERERVMAHETADKVNGDTNVSESSGDEAENWEAVNPKEESPVDKTSVLRAASLGRREHVVKSPQSLTSLGKINGYTRGGSVSSFDHEGSSSEGVRSSAGALNATTTVGTTTLSENDTSGFEMETEKVPRYGGGDGVETGDQRGNWHDMPIVQEFTEDEVVRMTLTNPGWEGCRACFTLPCRWCSCTDHGLVEARKKQIKNELFRLMGLWDQDEVCTLVPLSCVRGGDTTLLRREAIRELRWEATELDRRLHLADVDKELHDAYSCTEKAIEVQSLHSYPTLMWCKDAQMALSTERDLVLARNTAGEVVDDLLESMLDGWMFGERNGEYSVGGIVPAVKASGPLRPGDQRRAVAYLAHRYRLRRIAHAMGERLPEEIKGTHKSKALLIDGIAQQRILDSRALKAKEDQKHLLQETETTMKFGLFSMVQGYLHAMRLVEREKDAWSGRGDVITRGSHSNNSQHRAPLTVERKKMVQEEVKARERVTSRKKFLERALRAEARDDLRTAQNKRRVSQRNAMRVLEIRAKDKAARNIQRVFRGFRGKVFAQRWALKRAEIDALKYVLHEAAVNVQRVYRSHLGRVEASEVRMELAEYIAGIRVKEAEYDLADFWKTHTLKATKDNLKKKMLHRISAPLLAIRKARLE